MVGHYASTSLFSHVRSSKSRMILVPLSSFAISPTLHQGTKIYDMFQNATTPPTLGRPQFLWSLSRCCLIENNERKQSLIVGIS
jgi:hypothetical protein